jgi:hypothetical protein
VDDDCPWSGIANARRSKADFDIQQGKCTGSNLPFWAI